MNQSFNPRKKGNPNKCWYCGQEEACTKDHFIPRSKGGRTMVYACRLCQFSKGDMMPLEWLEYITSHAIVKEEVKSKIATSVHSLIHHLFNATTTQNQSI